MDNRFTPWHDIFSHESDARCGVTMVIEARGHGKTFGMREQLLRDWLKDGSRFVVVVRHANRITDVMRGFFDALSKPDPDGLPSSMLMRSHRFRFDRDGATLKVAEIPVGADDDYRVPRGGWDTIGYFVALSQAQNAKEQTFVRVRRIVFDEALIERPTARHTYLPNEYDDLVSLVSSVTREQIEGGAVRAHVYMLANACNIANPYFERFGVDRVPPKGFSKWGGGMFLLYIGDDREYSSAVASKTLAGRMGAFSDYNSFAADNEFMDSSTDMVAKRPKTATPRCVIKANGRDYGVWFVSQTCRVWIGYDVPKGGVPVYVLTTADTRIDYHMIAQLKERGGLIDSIAWYYRHDGVRFGSIAARRNFEADVLRLYGLR